MIDTLMMLFVLHVHGQGRHSVIEMKRHDIWERRRKLDQSVFLIISTNVKESLTTVPSTHGFTCFTFFDFSLETYFIVWPDYSQNVIVDRP